MSGAPCTPGAARSAADRPPGRLTITGGATLHTPREVGPATDEWLRIAPTFVRLSERRERDQRLVAERTAAAPRAVDWIFAAETSGSRMYYFESSRRVADRSVDADADTDPPGTLRIAVAGFVREQQGDLVALGTKSELRWEQDGLPAGPSRPDLTPLAVVPLAGGSVWVMKGQSGASTWFTLYEVSPGGTRTLLARIGGC